MKIRISIQIALSLALLSLTIVMLAPVVGLVPDQRQQLMTARISLCENLAVSCSLLAGNRQNQALEVCLRELLARNPEVLSAGLRRLDGHLATHVGEHELHWIASPDGRSTDAAVYVPILQADKKWGHLEVAFRPLFPRGWAGWIDWSWVRLVAFIGSANALVYFVYLGKVFYELDPSRVMPQRVRSALDTLTEGLLVLDDRGRIVMANQAISSVLGRDPESLLGVQASQLPLLAKETTIPPWEDVVTSQAACRGVEMSLPAEGSPDQMFLVNAAPILDQRGVSRGVLASFHDVTQLEEKKRELLKMLEALRDSRDKIRQRNDELAYLATRDPLTACLNRRSFFEQFEVQWRSPNIKPGELSCLMVDIDKFKSINDQFGHATGDEVLKKVAASLLKAVGDTGLVCRYGGEEFCILLPHCDLAGAEQVGDRLRQRIESLPFPKLNVTASVGVSSRSLDPGSPQELLDQADKSLYCSKRSGRNCVTRWDHVPGDFDLRQENVRGSGPPPALVAAPTEEMVPYRAVASLMSALAYRDPATASHSARVADLCVATARGLLTAGESYILEIAALLHDIGKIGVPDSILLKPGPLTTDEWEIMQMHARMGVEIVNASFRCDQLVEIVRCHHAVFAGDVSDPSMPKGQEIPLGARLVSIADAYDAMVSDRVYRKGRPPEAAFAELRRTAGRQFDPELVERFIEVVSTRQPVESAALGAVNKELALNLGLQTERLAKAIDDQDIKSIRALALHLETVARQHGLVPMQKAAEMLQASATDSDLPQMVHLIQEIIEMSLVAQQAYLTMNHDMAQASLARNRFVVEGSSTTPLAS